MLNLILAGGWLMVPLLICSILALAIIIERSWQLRYDKVIPQGLSDSIINDLNSRTLSNTKLKDIEKNSPLGSLFTIVLKNIKKERVIILSTLEESGKSILHNLEKNLNMLGTIATIAPLLGLLGTVIGMIDVFAVITEQGVGNPNTLAGGISQALITTAVGLSVAIPSLIYYRSFQRKLDEISHKMEFEAIYLVDSLKANIKKNNKENA